MVYPLSVFKLYRVQFSGIVSYYCSSFLGGVVFFGLYRVFNFQIPGNSDLPRGDDNSVISLIDMQCCGKIIGCVTVR